MLSEKEKKAINNMKLFARVHQDMTVVTVGEMDIVLKLVEKQQEEIEQLKAIEIKAKGGRIKVTLEGLIKLQEEIEKKDKIINEMAETFSRISKGKASIENNTEKDKIIDYFTKKVLEE